MLAPPPSYPDAYFTPQPLNWKAIYLLRDIYLNRISPKMGPKVNVGLLLDGTGANPVLYYI
jgi:hypothetical protein